MISEIATLLSRINPFTTTGLTGPDAIRTAVQELQDLTEREFTATLGEPEIVPQTNQFVNDPKVAVPINDGPFEESQRLVFDLPRGEDEEMDQFNQLLALFGLTFETMEELTGQEAPVRFVGGNLVVDWRSIQEPASLDKGGEEDVEEMVGDETDSNVNVEETTISSDGEADG